MATKTRQRKPTVKSVPEIFWNSNEEAYRALKWFEPQAIRTIRGAFDAGVTLKKLLNTPEGVNADMVQAAMQFMSENPKTGRVKWDGTQFDWIEDEYE